MTYRKDVGSQKKLGIVRYGRDQMDKHERLATEQIFPGQAVTPVRDADGNMAYALHDGTAADPLHIAVEARGRGMDAQTDTGYTENDVVKAMRCNGGGLNLRVSAGETVADSDPLEVAADGSGDFVVGTDTTSGVLGGNADEDADLSGDVDPSLVRANTE